MGRSFWQRVPGPAWVGQGGMVQGTVPGVPLAFNPTPQILRAPALTPCSGTRPGWDTDSRGRISP